MSTLNSPCTRAFRIAMGALVAMSTLILTSRAADPSPFGRPRPAMPILLAAAKGDVEHVDATKAADLLSAKTNIVVLDVRTPREFKGGHIAGATNINFNADNFSKSLEKLDRNKTYLVHCAAGGRSTKSLDVLRKLGFRSIVHLDGGFSAWEAAGKPVVKEP